MPYTFDRFNPRHFNPRPPAEGDNNIDIGYLNDLTISIHALPRRATHD